MENERTTEKPSAAATAQSESDVRACSHLWVSNSGEGGDPVFTPNRYMAPDQLMHVKCFKCRARTWFTEKQWQEDD